MPWFLKLMVTPQMSFSIKRSCVDKFTSFIPQLVGQHQFLYLSMIQRVSSNTFITIFILFKYSKFEEFTI